MSASLLSGEAAADAQYGLPAGTMEYIGTKESSQGSNLGSIGNIFQVVPSTAIQPGYGLLSVDGNDPSSTAAYVAALRNANGGSLSAALSQYSGGAYDGSDMSTVLGSATQTSASSGSTSSTSSLLNTNVGNLLGGSVGQAVSNLTTSNGSAATQIGSWLGLTISGTDLLFIIVAIMLIGAGLLSLVLSSKAGGTVAKIGAAVAI